MSESTKKNLTVSEVAELLNVSEDTVYRQVSQRALTAFRVGKLVRVKREEVDAYVEKQTLRA